MSAGERPAGGQRGTAREPWWRVGVMWAVIGGPLLVVVAATVTAVIAWRGADPVLDPSETGARTTQPIGSTPAHQARNHAATAMAPADLRTAPTAPPDAAAQPAASAAR